MSRAWNVTIRLKSVLGEAFEECLDAFKVAQSVADENGRFPLAVCCKVLEKGAEAILVVVLGSVGGKHRLEHLGDRGRILWREPEEFCDELVTLVPDMNVRSDGFQEVPFAGTDRGDVGG